MVFLFVMFLYVPMIGFAAPIWVCDDEVGKVFVVEEKCFYQDDSNNGDKIIGVDCNVLVTLNDNGKQIYTERFGADEEIILLEMPTTRFRIINNRDNYRQNDYLVGYTRNRAKYVMDLHTSNEAGIVNINDDPEFMLIFRKAYSLCR